MHMLKKTTHTQALSAIGLRAHQDELFENTRREDFFLNALCLFVKGHNRFVIDYS